MGLGQGVKEGGGFFVLPKFVLGLDAPALAVFHRAVGTQMMCRCCFSAVFLYFIFPSLGLGVKGPRRLQCSEGSGRRVVLICRALLGKHRTHPESAPS